MKRSVKKSLQSLICAMFITSAAQAADHISIPEMGTAGARGMTVQTERLYGEYFMRKARGAGIISYDPVMTEFINSVGQKLVLNANNVYFPFEFFLSADPSLNAAAFLGGKVQVNAGLFHYTDNEDEFASVLAHEISHITQRHIARFIEEQSDRGAISIASIIGSIALAILNPTVGAAAFSTSAGLMAQTGINFTRDNEYEADRIGISVLEKAGYNPMAMSTLFKKLFSMQGNINSAYALLIDHPLSEIRVAEAYNRAKNMPKRNNSTDPNFMFAKARVDVRYMNLKLKEFKERLLNTEKVNRYYKNYALSLIYYGEKNYSKAKEYLEKLSSMSSNDFIVDLYTDIDLESGNTSSAIARLRALYSKKPYDSAITINLANAYLKAREGKQAQQVLEKFLQKYPNDSFASEMLTESFLQQKNKCQAFITHAQTMALKSDYTRAFNSLNDAMHTCKGSYAQIARAQYSKISDQKDFDEKLEKRR